MSGNKGWEGLAKLEAEVWIQVIDGFAIGVLARNDVPSDPFVAGDDSCVQPRQGIGHAGGDAVAILCGKLAAQRSVPAEESGTSAPAYAYTSVKSELSEILR